jgi:hypothetical protein
MKMTTLLIRYSIKMPPERLPSLLISLAFSCFALSPQAGATCQDACLTNDNTVQGDDALISLTTGTNNAAIGFQSLHSDTTGSFNTAIGWEALTANTAGSQNTANGNGALFANTGGNNNTATGSGALGSNTTGSVNTANGSSALGDNTTGFANTADGNNALESNTIGSENTALGDNALGSNTTGNNNTADGLKALFSNTIGEANVAVGHGALVANETGSQNVAIGSGALESNTTGGANVAVGNSAGELLTTGSQNIYIGSHVTGLTAESNTIRIGHQNVHRHVFIGGISRAAVSGSPVVVDAGGQLGVMASSARFKTEIKPMDKASEAVLDLKPVTFRYKPDVDPEGIPQFGLVAEQVEKVNPDLVAHDEQGKAYTVRYEAVNAMLLNEFLKEHRKVESLEKAMAEQQQENATMRTMLKEQAAQIQKVSTQLAAASPSVGGRESSRPVPQMVVDNH